MENVAQDELPLFMEPLHKTTDQTGGLSTGNLSKNYSSCGVCNTRGVQAWSVHCIIKSDFENYVPQSGVPD